MTDDNQFTALVLEDAGDGKVTARIESLANDRLPEGDVTVGVEYSTLNYKDGMIVQGVGRLVREYPHVPGIDFAGMASAAWSTNIPTRQASILPAPSSPLNHPITSPVTVCC